ncbi:MAG: penicillin-binding protein activator [Rhodospirillales bacterium]|jgi:branched-chain amino acid transport system substrate-binding protein|nr:penicillin-binding protein activator [Rhodospirillales bacterium]
MLVVLLLGGCASRVATSPGSGQGAAAPSAATPPQAITEAAPQASAGGRVRVALLLPLSGPTAGLGRALLDAAQMAVFDVADQSFTLLPRDTQGTPEGAARAATAAIGDGAQLILGPLLAGEVEAVKPIARQAHVNIVAFSTSDQLADDSTFLLSVLPRQTVQRVVAFARERGATRFAALAPSTPYGQLVVAELRSAAAANGGSADRVQFYDPAANDLRPTVRALVGYDPQKSGRDQPQPAAAAAAVDFDAIMLPDGGPKLKAVASLLPYFDVDTSKIRLLGTGLWDDPGIGSEPALVGGWFAAPDPAARSDFEARFRDLYKQAPPRLATLGYDGAALAALLAKRSPGTAFTAQSIADPSGFAGVDGIFRFHSDGRIERGLAVLEVQKSGARVVSPAPETFEQPNM